MLDLLSTERKTLLQLARDSIKHYLETGDRLEANVRQESLTQKCGCFVTLRKNALLRGCVGTFSADQPLFQNVLRMSIAAAVQDTRFPPVSKPEVTELKIEISVIGETFPMTSPDEIEIGKHGVLVEHGNRSGTFLPDVAVEQNWNAQEFILWCAREKAGLKPAEIANARVSLYEVIKFSE